MEKKIRSDKPPIKAISGKICEDAFIKSGRNPGHLARFLKKYPAAHFLSWVQAAIAEWGANGNFDNLKLLQPTKGQRKDDSGLMQAYTDFLIYKAVTEMIEQGHKLTSNKNEGGIFYKLCNTNFNGKYLSESQIKTRYYRFVNHEPATLIDDNKTMISGPARVQILGFDYIGFWTYKPKKGFKPVVK